LTLTDKQLRKIFAAQQSGLSKRELFESEVAGHKIGNLSKEERDRLVGDMMAKRPIPTIYIPKTKITEAKADAIISLTRDKKAKEAFLKQDSIRLQSFRAKELR